MKNKCSYWYFADGTLWEQIKDSINDRVDVITRLIIFTRLMGRVNVQVRIPIMSYIATERKSR